MAVRFFPLVLSSLIHQRGPLLLDCNFRRHFCFTNLPLFFFHRYLGIEFAFLDSSFLLHGIISPGIDRIVRSPL